ncbi:hypothetical protein PINS_up000447 [Pythium insidiosum]|nr:hypothetical protein PINS_up000447 [Pythium insidiosum]
MAPSRKRQAPPKASTPVPNDAPPRCACLSRPHSDGICELNVWQGTMIDLDAPTSRLLRPGLPVVKYKEWRIDSLTGPMHHMIAIGWIPLFAVFLGIYFAVVGLFALLFALCNTDLDLPTISGRDYFNLSLQTMATIGYGVLFPHDTCSNWVAVSEAFVSMIVISLTTGVAFVKFARPRPHLIFSKIFTVSERETGGLEMRFRVVNATRRDMINHGEILEATFKLILMRVEDTNDGDKRLCYYDLKMKTASFITLRLEAELVHHVDESSPFFGMSEDDVKRSDFLLILIMSGVDENLHDIIHKKVEYSHEHISWGAKFASMLSWDAVKETVELDFDLISAIVPAPIQALGDSSVAIACEESSEQKESIEDGGIRMSEWNVEADDGEEIDLGRLRHPSLGGRDARLRNRSVTRREQRASTESRNAVILEQDRVSNGSTHTNSGSEVEDGDCELASTRSHVRFDRRSRVSSFRLPRLSRTQSRRRMHEHGQHNEPSTLKRRRVRFKNHPLSRFSKGLYYRALESSWLSLFLWFTGIYFTAIALMALLILLTTSDSVFETVDVKVRSKYERIFFFCAQTISTIGYGSLAPNPDNSLVNFFVAVLAITGTVVSTLLTGLAWAKFSIPNASVIRFSDDLLLTAFHSHRAIMFRAANNRTYGNIIEGSFRVSVVIMNHRRGRRETYELKIERNVWPIVALGTTVTHIIDHESPLYQFSTDELLSGEHFFVVLFSGIDNLVGETMFSRKTYHSCDIQVGHHFVDYIKLAPDGLHIDLEAINETKLTPDVDLRNSRLFATGQGGGEDDESMDDISPYSDQSNLPASPLRDKDTLQESGTPRSEYVMM